MAIFILLGLILAVLPVIVTVETYFDSNCNKLGCVISLYGFIKILGGYLAPCTGGVAFHVSEKKAILFSARQMREDGNRFFPKRGIRIRHSYLYAEVGVEHLLQTLYIQQIIKGIALFANKNTLESRLTLHQDDCIRLYTSVSVRTTTLRQVMELTKYLWGRLAEKWQRKKSAA